MGGFLKLAFDAASAALAVVLADQIKQRGPEIIDYAVKHAPEFFEKLKNKFHKHASPQQPQQPQPPTPPQAPQQLMLPTA